MRFLANATFSRSQKSHKARTLCRYKNDFGYQTQQMGGLQNLLDLILSLVWTLACIHNESRLMGYDVLLLYNVT
jgi:hypothetical protein